MEKYNKYHESLDIDCCDNKIINKVKSDCCCDGIKLPSHDNEIEILIMQLKKEVANLMKTTQAKLLCQSKKIDETMIYIKNNLSNSIRNLLNSMLNSGELDDIITDTVLSEISLMENYISKMDTKLNTEIDNRTTSDENLQSQINSLTSGSPLVANSISDMTDTSRIYVNTSDGYWYYYNGSEWLRGGIYQSSQPSDLLETYSKYIPQMIKDVVYGKLKIYFADNNLTVNLIGENGQENCYFITDNHLILTGSLESQYVFPITNYNIKTGTWALVVNSNDVKVDLINVTNNANELNYNDCILCMFSQANTRQITTSQNNVYYNDKDISVATKDDIEPIELSSVLFVKDIIYGNVEITVNDINTIVELNGSNNQVAPYFITDNRVFYPASGMTTSYIFPRSEYNVYSGTWALVYDLTDKDIKLINIFNNRNVLNNNQCIICIFSQGNQRQITEVQNALYYNDKDISLKGTEHNIETLSYDFLRCFKNFTVIGDSLACGYTKVGDVYVGSVDAKESGNNWPSYLCSRLDRTLNNLAVGGSTAKLWRENYISSAENIETDCYFVGIGVNDLRTGLTVGTSADINTGDYTQNSDSFYGNYDYMINELMSYNPNAKIFVFTIPNSETNPVPINTAIKYIASLYENVYVIDLYTLYDFRTGFIASNLYNGHYNPIAYNYISVLIEKAVNEYIYNNPTDFNIIPYSES